MKKETRNKMVLGAMDLIRRRGVNATSVREVVRYTDTPRGSIKHHFPNGKLQLVIEAVELAGKEVSQSLQYFMNEKGTINGLRKFIGMWRNILESTNYAAGCSVLAVASEQYIGEDGNPQLEAEKQLLELAESIFKEWQYILEASLQRDGVESLRARRLARLIISSIEGTVALCRASQNSLPLDDVQIELEILLNNLIMK